MGRKQATHFVCWNVWIWKGFMLMLCWIAKHTSIFREYLDLPPPLLPSVLSSYFAITLYKIVSLVIGKKWCKLILWFIKNNVTRTVPPKQRRWLDSEIATFLKRDFHYIFMNIFSFHMCTFVLYICPKVRAMVWTNLRCLHDALIVETVCISQIVIWLGGWWGVKNWMRCWMWME